MRSEYRGLAIIGLIMIAELSLVGFAFLSLPLKVIMNFLNGLPLGMIFGLILSYLEGRRQTEALSAALCASFIVSSGVVKSVGTWLMDRWNVSEFHMPMVTGLLFFVPLLVAVWILQATPPPDAMDRAMRAQRSAMNAQDRRGFVRAFWPGLSLLIVVYVALTIVRTIRDDFGVEIWAGLWRESHAVGLRDVGDMGGIDRHGHERFDDLDPRQSPSDPNDAGDDVPRLWFGLCLGLASTNRSDFSLSLHGGLWCRTIHPVCGFSYGGV